MDDDVDSRLHFGSQYKFPLKLMEVANDGFIIKWTDDEKGLLVQEAQYEEHVMEMYPGFVQVETFHNLRRLFRDYNFKYHVRQRSRIYGRLVEFRNSFFIKNDYENLHNVHKQPRLKKIYLEKIRPLATSSPQERKSKMHITQPRVHNPKSLVMATLKKHLYQSSKFIPDQESPETSGLFDDVSERFYRDSSIRKSKLDSSRFMSAFEKQQHCHEQDWTLPNFPISPNCSYELFSGAEINSINSVSRCKYTRRSLLKYPERNELRKYRKSTKTLEDNKTLALLQIYAKNELTEGEFWEVMTKRFDEPFNGMSWEMVKDFLDKTLIHHLSPLHFKGFYHELTLSEM